ncbi:MAG: threonine/serine dehydratase [Alphaproteobacteria bacterium]|nr:threonine/serine dehydratase [Alphaproteobacteria bacterium]MCY4609150.1 threonine/serine dehydratase [bacterium]
MPDMPSYADIESAARRLAGKAVITPLLESPRLNDTLGGRLLVKPECLQLTGSFKFRGAFNRIAGGTTENGVVAYSSGNHAQGVAAAASMLGYPAVIVMPEDAPAIKIAGTRAWGADIVTYSRHDEAREEIAGSVARKSGMTLVPPYDDPMIIAGQGTVGLEIADACAGRDIAPDAVITCCGGGGLTAGVALAISHRFPGCAIHTAEPEGWDDTARSLLSGERQSVTETSASICDALLARRPGKLTFEVNRNLVHSGTVVTESAVIRAMVTALTFFKLVAEPGGAAALASAISGMVPVKGRTIVAIISGGNVDADVYADLVARGQS